MARSTRPIPSVARRSRTATFQKKGGYKFTSRQGVAKQQEEKPAVKEVTTKSGKRSVPTEKAPRFYPAEDVRQAKVSRKVAKQTKLKSNITPGTVLILLAGRFRGKRVVFLKQLDSGLLLVTGPFKINGVPIRRVNQAYVIATSTKLDISDVKVDDKLNDTYFKKEKAAKAKAEAAFFSESSAEKKAHPESKVADQKALDKSVIAAVKKAGPTMAKYLAASFSLSKGDKPHALKF
ncbi:putative 60S large subunit ribosomal protein L6 [Testicularia cyperi]|uniref:60S ribosomal protein L6 n=1 Tax=Testicularia cyperi TaxID=1882483 RepID=A0A317XW89_9BASI|nr:putative 60S large subunit ribosomal protein L6 [Testicularia cyperi]